jgi:hypothetical protein
VKSVRGCWIVTGDVQPGDRRGRVLGFPTANLYLDSSGGPEDGVWAATVSLAGARYAAAVSLGRRSTYYGASGRRVLEAHLLDFNRDIYDQRIMVVLRQYLRPQRNFDGSVALMRQLDIDVAATRAWAEAAHPREAVRGATPRGARKGSTPESALQARARRRERLIAAAARDALDEADMTHERVAALAGVPVGFLRWAYPRTCDLYAVAQASVTFPHSY